jgi:hypothetical protein
MSTILSSRERELAQQLKQKEAELKQANAELVRFVLFVGLEQRMERLYTYLHSGGAWEIALQDQGCY